MSFSPNKELYCLVLYHDKSEMVSVGSLGEIEWDSGFTYYVGRASYGWSSRLARLTDNARSTHWHIDYLTMRPTSRVKEIFVFDEKGEHECDLSKLLENYRRLEPIHDGFGASDCDSNCTAHCFVSNHGKLNVPKRLKDSDIMLSGTVKINSKSCVWLEN